MGSLRAATAGLTTRGRCFLAAGAAAAASAVVLGERDLLRVAVLLVALPLLSLAVVLRTRYRLSCARRVEPTRVRAGQTASVVLRLDNVSRLPTGLLLLEDALPYSLGGRPRFVLDRVEPRGVREVTLPGALGRARPVPGGPAAGAPDRPVRPRRAAALVHHHRRPGGHPDGGPARRRCVWAGPGPVAGSPRPVQLASHGEDDSATREYRVGDDLRRVHWRSTAHRGELMVRREEQPWQNRAVLLLDTRAMAHRGEGPGGSFEWSVTAAASIGAHLMQAGYRVRLVDDLGTSAATEAGHGGPGLAEGVLLERLAVVSPSENRFLSEGLAGLRQDTEGLVVAVLGACEEPDARALAALRGNRSSCLAVVVDPDSWGRGRRSAETARTVQMLSAGGWGVATAGAGEDLAALWTRLLGGAGLAPGRRVRA